MRELGSFNFRFVGFIEERERDGFIVMVFRFFFWVVFIRLFIGLNIGFRFSFVFKIV